MNNLLLEQDQFIRSVEISKNDVFSVLLGAGASITSGIPSAVDCIWKWKRNIYTSKHSTRAQKLDIKSEQVQTQIQKWLDSEGAYPSIGADEEYSFYVEECYPIEDDRRKFFQRICEKKQPSIGYKLLSLLHETGLIQSVWTTNFDDLGLNAARIANLLPIDITLDTIDRIVRPQNSAELPYIKLHGDYKYGPLKNTEAELAAQDATFRKHLVNYLTEKHLIVSGYSGRDQSVMEALKESYRSRGAGRLYWCGYGRDIPHKVKELLELARANGRTAYYIPTDGFDKLFVSLASVCTKGSEEYAKKFKELLSVTTTTDSTPFTIPQTRIDTVIKSNLFRISFPQEVFQFKFPFVEGEKPWSTLREMTAGHQVVAVPYKGMVYAIGTLTQINALFEARMKGKITRVPLENFNLQKDTAFYSLLLSGITDLLGTKAGLSHDKRSLIWKADTVSQRRINDVIYQTHEAIRLAINTDGSKHYLSFMPDFKATSEKTDEKISKTILQEIGLSYFAKIFNNKFNDYLKNWRTLLFSAGGGLVELDYPYQSGSGLVYKIDRDNAFAGIMTPKPGKIGLSSVFNQKLIHHSGVQYAEPELVFAPKNSGMRQAPKDFHPMRGVSTNKPYDYSSAPGVRREDPIRLAVVCPLSEASKFQTFLSRHLSAIGSMGVNKAYLLSFPGFQQAFATQLIVPDPGTENWAFSSNPVNTESIKEAAAELRNMLIASIEKLTKDGQNKVVILFIPMR